MSSGPAHNVGSRGILFRMFFSHSDNHDRNNTVAPIGNPSTSSSLPLEIVQPTPEVNSQTWLHKFKRIDLMFSGSLLVIPYRIIDITLLLIGLCSASPSCEKSNPLCATAIALLCFYFIDLFIIFSLFIRNFRRRHVPATDDERFNRLTHAWALRGFFLFFKIIPVCVGTGYCFSTETAKPVDCELMRFCLGLVCFSTWLLLLYSSSRPETPVRRSLILESIILVLMIIINVIYFGTVGAIVDKTNHSTCLYQTIEDLYMNAPLRSYGFFGLILFSSTIFIRIVNLLINQISFRTGPRAKRFYLHFYGFYYPLSYLNNIAIIYYFATGALLLFQPRSGGTCRYNAPELYQTLLIWEWIRILSPLFIVVALVLFCCLGVCFGAILSQCLPASIAVPLVDLLQGWVAEVPTGLYPNPPATQRQVDSIPTVRFGQQPDPFNQTECAICQSDFESAELLKRLECGHLFHNACVSNWLLTTRICPICRRRMSTTHRR